MRIKKKYPDLSKWSGSTNLVLWLIDWWFAADWLPEWDDLDRVSARLLCHEHPVSLEYLSRLPEPGHLASRYHSYSMYIWVNNQYPLLSLYLSLLWVWIAFISTSVSLSVSPVGVDCYDLHLCLCICLTCGRGLLWSSPLSLYLSHMWAWIAMISTSVPLSVSPVGVDCCGLCSQSPPLSLYPYGSKSDPSQLQVDL